MLDTVVAEQPMFDLRIFPALGRLFKGLTKVFAQPVRVEFVQDDKAPLEPASGAVYSVQPIDGKKREIYIYCTDEGPLDWEGVFFVERNAEGKLSRVVSDKEERVPDEWRNAIKAHVAKEQEDLIAAQPFRVTVAKKAHQVDSLQSYDIVYSVQPFDGEKREVSVRWKKGRFSDSFFMDSLNFVELSQSGEITKIIPKEEERVPSEWCKAIAILSSREKDIAAAKHVLG